MFPIKNVALLALAMVLAAGPLRGQSPAVETPSFVHEGVIDAPADAVWQVWSTSEGYKKLGVAFADVDLRIGGLIRSRYGADGALGDDATIENRILAFEPKRMIAIQIARPPAGFPFREAWKQTWTVITLTPLGPDRTTLRVASLGFGSDPESVQMRAFFDAGNAATLKHLQEQFSRTAARPPRP